MDDEDYEMYKIVVIGDTGTGKTNITTKYLKNEFHQESKATIGVQFMAHIININNNKVKITIWDTAGQQRYKSLSKVYYKGAAGIILVYSTTQYETYYNLESWLKLANQNLNSNQFKVIVVGNKCDLKDQKVVDFEKVKAEYKDKYKIQCFQVSAKTGQGISQAMTYLTTKIYEMNHNVNGSRIPFLGESQKSQVQKSNLESVQEEIVQQIKESKQQRVERKKNSQSIQPRKHAKKQEKKKCC